MHAREVVSPDLFPALWTRPPYEAIMACLNSLDGTANDGSRLDDDNNDDDDAANRPAVAVSAHHVRRDAGAVARYLGDLVMSGLAWIADEDAREAVWTTASQRLAARCGRTALGTITRRWPLVDTTVVKGNGNGNGTGASIDLYLEEPALVGDDAIGFKTWGTAYVLAQMLPALAVFNLSTGGGHPVLELGAGTGLLGLAAAVLWGADVVLSDLAAIVPNLAANVARKRSREADLGINSEHIDADADMDPLLFPRDHQFPLVLAADPLYDDDHPALLADDKSYGRVRTSAQPSAICAFVVLIRFVLTRDRAQRMLRGAARRLGPAKPAQTSTTSSLTTSSALD
ncbi:glucose-inducible sam-dependent methyltransferase [Niveomyces insectorum RCEF 264]|uniref:Glucose-inducible sam-dependent methyltransferase n=1 Tax=Niveomyces insectorum RCEF 264 TaxID=1081102 RepID=A0A167N0P3_9HYPO|nr:glucose-inducible sam-dependent methyltransferase [Niveomyces insectorum RCEF 264]